VRILIKFPTRGRKEKFFDVLESYIVCLAGTNKPRFLITLDTDDTEMAEGEIDKRLNFYRKIHNIEIFPIWGRSENKISAINRDIHLFDDWDILLVASDDMYPTTVGYDIIIDNDMQTYHPDTDGVLYYPDGYTTLNTLPILGRKYYQRFNYVYYPGYKSFFCDNEFHIVAELLGKHTKIGRVMFKHEHPANTKNAFWDELYKRNNSSWKEDEELFNQRKLINFGVDNAI